MRVGVAMPYLSIARRVNPKPKAKPEYFSVSMSQKRKTLGCISPAGKTSIHVERLQTEQPSLQNGQRISISTPGSTKGKNPGRMRMSSDSFLNNVLSSDKIYFFSYRFGLFTNSGDINGKIINFFYKKKVRYFFLFFFLIFL